MKRRKEMDDKCKKEPKGKTKEKEKENEGKAHRAQSNGDSSEPNESSFLGVVVNREHEILGQTLNHSLDFGVILSIMVVSNQSKKELVGR